jgi:hypothetical protein
VSTFILVESIYVLMNLKLYFGMLSLSLNLFRVVVGKKLTYDPIIFHYSIVLCCWCDSDICNYVHISFLNQWFKLFHIGHIDNTGHNGSFFHHT